MNVNDEFYKKGRDDAIEQILIEAKNFECCPDCGDVNDGAIHHHLCDKCKERVAVPDDAYWFYEYLAKKFKS